MLARGCGDGFFSESIHIRAADEFVGIFLGRWSVVRRRGDLVPRVKLSRVLVNSCSADLRNDFFFFHFRGIMIFLGSLICQ